MRLINYIKKIKDYNTSWFLNDFKKFISLNAYNNEFEILKNYPCIGDRKQLSGVYSGGAYFFQDIYMAHMIFKNSPIKHVDIGSRIDECRSGCSWRNRWANALPLPGSRLDRPSKCDPPLDDLPRSATFTP